LDDFERMVREKHVGPVAAERRDYRSVKCTTVGDALRARDPVGCADEATSSMSRDRSEAWEAKLALQLPRELSDLLIAVVPRRRTISVCLEGGHTCQ
jgi:hypothetical protein